MDRRVENFQKLYNDSVTELKEMYHYCSPDAFISIVSNKSLRFTNCLFLNDKKEYNYIIDEIIIPAIDGKIEEIKIDAGFINTLKGTLDRDNITLEYGNKKIFRCSYYVLCGSKDNDNLPLWTYYSKSNRYEGYSLGLNLEELCDYLASKNYDGNKINVCYRVIYGEIIYDKKTQISIVKKVIDRINAECKKEQGKILNNLKMDQNTKDELLEDTISTAQEDLYDFFCLARLFFKPPYFAHEKEARVAILLDEDAEIKFTSKNGLIRPHVDIELGSLPITLVTISPTINDEVEKDGVKRLISSYNKPLADDLYKNNKIINSGIKLRF